jgi:hypothetical protein
MDLYLSSARGGRATLGLNTIHGEFIDVVRSHFVSSTSNAANYGVTLAEGEIAYPLAGKTGACKGATLVTQQHRPVNGQIMARLVVSEDIVFGTCEGGPPLLTLKAGSFVEFRGFLTLVQ